jgi:hypothetical protein
LAINNTANGNGALNVSSCISPSSGGQNTASGAFPLYSNTTGFSNVASGYLALFANTTGYQNAVTGAQALSNNTTGLNNTATGYRALVNNTTGYDNIALGNGAGEVLFTGFNNIDIGHSGVDASESNTIRIGTNHTATFIAGISGASLPTLEPLQVFIDPATGQLGTGGPAFGQINQDIKAMDTAIAQQRDEFKALVAEQRKSIELLTARVKAQDDQLQRVTVRMEQNRITPKQVANTK